VSSKPKKRNVTTVPAAEPDCAEIQSIRWRLEDRLLIDRLRRKTGIRSVTELVRKALRDCAEKEGL